MVCYPTRRFPSSSFTPVMYDFLDFILAHDLIDNPLFAGKFTWSNRRTRVSKSRIDCFLYTAEWEDCFVTISHYMCHNFQLKYRIDAIQVGWKSDSKGYNFIFHETFLIRRYKGSKEAVKQSLKIWLF